MAGRCFVSPVLDPMAQASKLRHDGRTKIRELAERRQSTRERLLMPKTLDWFCISCLRTRRLDGRTCISLGSANGFLGIVESPELKQTVYPAGPATAMCDVGKAEEARRDSDKLGITSADRSTTSVLANAGRVCGRQTSSHTLKVKEIQAVPGPVEGCCITVLARSAERAVMA
jgi:hypothetical protein